MYSDDQRNVFKYFNGEKEVFGDPLALYRRLLILTGGKPDELSEKVFINLNKATTEQVVAASQAHQQLCGIIREVFSMKPYNPEDDSGAKDEHCLMVWRQMATFLNQKKNPTVNLPTESQPTAGPPDLPTPTTSISA